MKTRQFIVLLIAIFLQPVIMYCWWGYRAKDIAFHKADREQVVDIYNMIQDLQD